MGEELAVPLVVMVCCHGNKGPDFDIAFLAMGLSPFCSGQVTLSEDPDSNTANNLSY